MDFLLKLGFILLVLIIGSSYTFVALNENTHTAFGAIKQFFVGKEIVIEIPQVQAAELPHVEKIEIEKVETKEETPEQIIRRVSRETGYSDDDLLVSIAKCESSLQPRAENPNSTATGVFQYLKGTWEDGVRRSGNNWTLEDRYDVEKSTRMTIFWITRGYLSKWDASKHCWGNQ